MTEKLAELEVAEPATLVDSFCRLAKASLPAVVAVVVALPGYEMLAPVDPPFWPTREPACRAFTLNLCAAAHIVASISRALLAQSAPHAQSPLAWISSQFGWVVWCSIHPRNSSIFMSFAAELTGLLFRWCAISMRRLRIIFAMVFLPGSRRSSSRVFGSWNRPDDGRATAAAVGRATEPRPGVVAYHVLPPLAFDAHPLSADFTDGAQACVGGSHSRPVRALRSRRNLSRSSTILSASSLGTSSSTSPSWSAISTDPLGRVPNTNQSRLALG